MNTIAKYYRALTGTGVDAATPIAMMDRVIFSNSVFLFGSAINIPLAIVNLLKGYHLLFALTVIYQIAAIACLWLNSRHRFLAARLIFLTTIYAGIFFSSLAQGPAYEIEHFFLPFGILAFTMFYAEERKFGFAYFAMAVAAYSFLVMQSQPLLSVDPALGRYGPDDLVANRVGYLALLLAAAFALATAFNRSLKLVDEQRLKLFEERRMASIGTIACTVAHEINSPLAALDLQLFQLERGMQGGRLADDLLSEGLARIKRISQRISVIVRGLKFLSGQDDNDPLSRMEAGAILDLALDLSRDRIESAGIDLRLRLEGRTLEVACRPIAMSQVFLNLLNNAVDAVTTLEPEKRWISIEIVSQGAYVLIAVEDGGSIVSEAVRMNLFKSFYTTKAPGRGTGLGLSISRETVEGHGGSLRFDETHPNTRFVVKLPVIRDEEYGA